MNFLYQCARPILASLDAETAHGLTLKGLQLTGKVGHPRAFSGEGVELAGLVFPNRVGLAAGFDKNGVAIAGLSRLGFGFLEIGAVTPLPQAGNPKPRLFRLPSERAVINRMGFNNDGVGQVRERLCAMKDIQPVLLGVNLGINKDTPIQRADDDYRACIRQLVDVVDFLTINISSPNTPHLRDLEGDSGLEALLNSVLTTRSESLKDKRKLVPIFVKVSPDLDPVFLRELALRVQAAGCDGLIATNTTVSRSGVEGRLAKQEGGLSGAPLLKLSLRAVEILRDAVGSTYPIIGVGGISSGEDAMAMRRAGADLIQVYTALVFRGPRLVRELCHAVA